jgi:hypothetical protein
VLLPSALLGLQAARQRLVSRAAALPALAAVGLSAVAGTLERGAAQRGAEGRALGSVFELVIPLATFALVGLLTGRRRLGEAAWALARFGGDRRAVTFGQVAATAVAAATLAAAASSVALLTSHGPDSPPLLSDVATSAWIAASTGAAYAAWFSLGATFLRFGGGRLGVLVVDFVLGSAGLVAWVLPRGLALNLLGLATFDLSQPGASVLLVLTTLLAGLAASLRSGR